jgi:riboflavin kinase / FMN adenylyltransferase
MTSPEPAIVTIGNFDGVHLGHQKLVHQVVDRARAVGVCSLAITFEPHPQQVLFPERRLSHLSTPEERIALLRANGVDDVWICPFTIELARLEPDDFMRMVADHHPIEELWVGSDFALGRGRRGTIAVLAEIGSHVGWGLHMVPPLIMEGQVVSSSAIRTLLAAGAVRGAADLLGHPYSVAGELEDREFSVDPLRALPKPMAYEAIVRQADVAHETVVTVLPTPGRIQLEADVELRNGPITIEFSRRAD